jgi:hypothetical protein
MKQDIIDEIDSTLKYIKGELISSFNEEDADLYIKWAKKKVYDTIQNEKEFIVNQEIKSVKAKTPIDYKLIKTLKKKKKKYEHQNYNHDLKIGDIVHVDYGFGYCGELSIGHYGIIMSEIKNNMYFIVALSSDPLNSFPFYFENLSLPNADCDKNKKSYVRFEQSRFLHYRRIENITINNMVIEKHLDAPQIVKLKEKFLEFMKLTVDK